MSPIHVIRLTATCPVCGAPPRIKVFPNVIDLADRDPETSILTYQCHRPNRDGKPCNTIYEIKARHFHTAA